jgi:pyridoxine 4-dehydrogenase
MTKPQATIQLGDRVITRLGLGTNKIEDNDASRAVLRAAVERGYGVIDTADIYTGQVSETVIGETVSADPSGITIATKGAMRRTDSEVQIDASPAYLASAIDASLVRLKRDVIDLYYLHKPSDDMEIEESVGALRDAQTAGKIKLIGLSNVSVEQLERARKIAKIDAVQNHFSLSERGHEDVLAYAEAHGIVFVPYVPIDKGKLGGGNSALDRIAAREGKTPTQIAISWLLYRSPVVLPIPGTLSVAHLEANLAALDIELSAADIADLNALGA